ncbi:MAG TPA: AgmX/PglI C-terminal domain-containing protein [Steroidobacteraceae bacterium]|nr:AgmX/PglI C-terminal domain-containing protein [Steroidobacteraceae bacterium]
MSMGLAPYFRRFELPWDLGEETERRFLKLVRILLVISTVLAIILFLLPMPNRERVKPSDLPERVVQLIVEKPKPPPPPPPPEPEKKPEIEKPKPTEQKPVEKPKPNVRNQGMLALQDELEALRDQNLDLADPQMKAPVADARSERNLITSQAGKASGGINTANMARGFGGGAGAIGTHSTTQVSHGAGLDPNAGGRVQRSGNSGKASRAREEVEIVFDRNKGALYALYGRALRDQPELAGKLVLEFTIAPSGEITMCRVVSSELKDPELEKKIVARVRLIRFKPADVEPLTVSKPIDFFPAA